MGAFILQFLFFCVFYPILCFWQWNERKHRRENYEHRLDDAVIRGDKEAAARYTEALVKLK